MKTRSLLVSLGLVLLLMGALSFLQKKVPGTERMTKESRRITNLPVREADRIDLTGPKGSFVFRKKAEGDWRLEKPIAGGADAVSVGQLLSEIQFVESLQTLPSGKKEESQLQTFGLGQPTRTLVVGTKEGELTIDTGRETPIAGGIYVRIRQPGRGEKIAVVQNQLAEAMDKDLTGWREKRVLPLQIPDVQELLLHQGTLEVDVIKKDGEWAILKPVEAQADPTDVANVLGELSSLKAASFVSDTGGDLALYGLNAPAQAFEVRTTATNRILQIGQVNPKETNQVFARVSDQPSVFLLPRAAIDSLGKMADRVRDKRVVTFTSAAQIQAVEFAGRGGDYRLERGKDTNRWTLQWAGNPRAADSARVDAWIVFLKEARANRFLPTEDPARLGLIKPRQTLTLFWAAPNGIQGTTNRVETLKFGDESKEDVFLQVSTTSGGMAVPLGLLRRIPETALGWLPLGIFPPDFGPVRGLIWAAGGVRKEYRSGADGRWRASGVGADVPEAAGYATRLAELEVVRWVGAPAKVDFAKTELEIVAEGGDGKKLRITVGRPYADGSAPIHVEGQELAGLLNRTQLAALKKDPRTTIAEAAPNTSQR